ncbi:MAG: peptide chain release factor-like protein [Nitrospinota bacterium]|nr:MAG: peptide chain release factor-like protein [Nitrospinota bacterium]
MEYTTDLEKLKEEVEFTFYKSSGPGGQKKNTTESAVRAVHRPTGITAIATEHRSQARNKALALQRIQERLQALQRPRKPRIPTQPGPAAIQKRKEEKTRQAQKKRLRKKVEPEDW